MAKIPGSFFFRKIDDVVLDAGVAQLLSALILCVIASGFYCSGIATKNRPGDDDNPDAFGAHGVDGIAI